MSPRPIWKHDCDNCLFLGNFNAHDLYFCSQSTPVTVIARYGSKNNYVSGIAAARVVTCTDPKDKLDRSMTALRVAYLIAEDMKLIGRGLAARRAEDAG